MPHIYSTLACDNLYTFWNENIINDVRVIEQSILIKGGANVAGKNLETPRGVVTEVSDKELALLETNEVFKLHKKNGFIAIEAKQVSVDKIAPLMEKDKSSQKEKKDFKVGAVLDGPVK